MAADAQFTLRVPKKLNDRIISAIAATENEVTRTGIFLLGAELLLAQLEICPSMLKNYNPALDKSARQKRKKQDNDKV